MPKIAYSEKRMGSDSLDIVASVNAIVSEYRTQGLVLTLRQVYYQFVSRGLLANSDKNYKRLGDIVSDGRMTGRIDWNAIEDRTRYLRQQPHWSSPGEIVSACAKQFRVNMWDTQPYYVEAWVEKDALVGVVESACDPLDVPHFSCRGYTSQTAMLEAAQRLRDKVRQGRRVVIMHLGDHDPSGVDMTRDIAERLSVFSGGYVDVKRLALNMEQVEEFNPPPNPAKLTDSRCTSYIQKYGDESWELDALEPKEIIRLIRDNVKPLIDTELWEQSERVQEMGRQELERVAEEMENIEWI